MRKTHYSVREIFNPNGLYGRWNWRGLMAYFVGFFAMVPFFANGLYTGPMARSLAGLDVGTVVGLCVSAVVYSWACKSIDIQTERRLVPEADLGLEAD